MEPSPSGSSSHPSEVTLAWQAGACCRQDAAGTMHSSCSRHITCPFWLAPGKRNVRMRLLPGLMGLKLFMQGPYVAPCAWANAGVILSLEVPLPLSERSWMGMGLM